MTREQLDINRICSDACGLEPELSWHVLSEDEKGSCFTAEKWKCEKWLAEMQKEYPNSMYSTYHVGSWKHYKNFYEDWNTRPQMLEVLKERGLVCKFLGTKPTASDTLSLSQPEFCEKFLKVLGVWQCE